MIVVNLTSGQRRFSEATRISTDEHNNLEVWGDDDGERLLWLTAAGSWTDVSISEGDEHGDG